MNYAIAMLNNNQYSIAKMKIWSKEQEAENLTAKFSAIKNQAEFARTFKVPGGASMINQHMSGHRPIGLEAAIAYARGFNCALSEISPRLTELFESAPLHNDQDNNESRVNVGRLSKQRRGILIEHYDAEGAMGQGIILKDQSGVIREWAVSEEWVRLNIKNYTSLANLKIVTGFGDSMVVRVTCRGGVW